MGTDIHSFVEIRNTKTGKWELAKIYSMNHQSDRGLRPVEAYYGRSYMLFGLLAGVRDCVTPLIPLRGIPMDVSDDVREFYQAYEEDWHSASWMTLSELNVFCRDKSIDKETGDKEYRRLLKGFRDNVDFIADVCTYYVASPDVRVVFWFDS